MVRATTRQLLRTLIATSLPQAGGEESYKYSLHLCFLRSTWPLVCANDNQYIRGPPFFCLIVAAHIAFMQSHYGYANQAFVLRKSWDSPWR
jgi:hypothetical protein